jgi:hypothetical protein
MPADCTQQPADDEVRAYADYLGFDLSLGSGQEVWALAQEALMAPLPPGWTAHLDAEGAEYFCPLDSQATTYEHPLDARYKHKYAELERKLKGS